MDPKWIEVAKSYLGEHEISGPKNNPKIMELLDWADGKQDSKNLQGINNDDIPWCASFVSGVLEKAGVPSAKTAWARGYLNWGEKLPKPLHGCIVVFERGPKAGHVGFVVGQDVSGNPFVLGGNQSDAVTVAKFQKSRVLGYRWPKGIEKTQAPIIKSSAAGFSRNEA